MIALKQLEMIDRIDQLIRLKNTGTPDELSSRLKISKTKLYRFIRLMKNLNAPIIYDIYHRSFVYEKEVSFKFGFYTNNPIRKEKNPHKLIAK
ncbi:hypothetical protein [Aquimarina megaterium]|uniref:hypothetical protein n=1 Tax=Aquimarina megaterium TaxID=1443666 RepID=UPI00047193DF|nr:hypothetical protein [Aquimarina megaterium]